MQIVKLKLFLLFLLTNFLLHAKTREIDESILDAPFSEGHQVEFRGVERKEDFSSIKKDLYNISPRIALLLDSLFQTHQYSTFGTSFSTSSDRNSVQIRSIKTLENAVGERNVFLPLFSESDKKVLLDRLNYIRDTFSEHIQRAVKNYIWEQYHVEAEVINIQVNGSSLYGWSKQKIPDDLDNVTLIRVKDDQQIIRDHMYDMGDHLKLPGINISGTAIQSVSGINEKHPHTQTALLSSYVSGIPIFTKECYQGEVDVKNLLFHAFSLLESGRWQFLSEKPADYPKWINRLLDVKAILFKLKLIDWFDHHKDWERFDEAVEKISMRNRTFIRKFINNSLFEYLEFREIIERALQKEKQKEIIKIVTAYKKCPSMYQSDFVTKLIDSLEKANGLGLGFPQQEPICRSWIEKRKLSMDKEAIEQEHLALLELNDSAINRSLAKNSPFLSVKQKLIEKGFPVVVKKSSENFTDREMNDLTLYFQKVENIDQFNRFLAKAIKHQEKALPILLKALFFGKKEYRRPLLEALCNIRSKRVVPFIVQLIPDFSGEEEDSLLVDLSLKILEENPTDSSLTLLFEMVKKKNKHSKKALRALASLSENPGIKFLIFWEFFVNSHEPKFE